MDALICRLRDFLVAQCGDVRARLQILIYLTPDSTVVYLLSSSRNLQSFAEGVNLELC